MDNTPILLEVLEKRGLTWDEIVRVTAGLSHPQGVLELADWAVNHPEATVDEMVEEHICLVIEYQVLTKEPMPILVNALKKHGLARTQIQNLVVGLSHKQAILDMAQWISDHPNATRIEISNERYRLMKEYQYPSYSTKRRKALRSRIQSKQQDNLP